MRKEEVKVLELIRTNKEATLLVGDAISTMRICRKLEAQLKRDFNSYRNCYGNQTEAVLVQFDSNRVSERVRTGYDIVRYDCIEELNALIGTNVVNMVGTDKQVCNRLYRMVEEAGLLQFFEMAANQ